MGASVLPEKKKKIITHHKEHRETDTKQKRSSHPHRFLVQRGSDRTPSWWPFPEGCWPPGCSCHYWCALGSGKSDSPLDSPDRSPSQFGCNHSGGSPSACGTSVAWGVGNPEPWTRCRYRGAVRVQPVSGWLEELQGGRKENVLLRRQKGNPLQISPHQFARFLC